MLGQICDTWSYLLPWQLSDASVSAHMYLDVLFTYQLPKLYCELLGSRQQDNVLLFFAHILVPSFVSSI